VDIYVGAFFLVCVLVLIANRILVEVVDREEEKVPVLQVVDKPKVTPLPERKVDTCQFCGRGIVRGETKVFCEGCGAPITPLAKVMEIPPPGPSNPLFRTGMESNLWHSNSIAQSMIDQLAAGINAAQWHNPDGYAELRGDDIVLAEVPLRDPDAVDRKLLGREKR
jgi:hypothetical protein